MLCAYLLTPTIIFLHFKFVTVSSLHWEVTKFRQAHKKNHIKRIKVEEGKDTVIIFCCPAVLMPCHYVIEQTKADFLFP